MHINISCFCSGFSSRFKCTLCFRCITHTHAHICAPLNEAANLCVMLHLDSQKVVRKTMHFIWIFFIFFCPPPHAHRNDNENPAAACLEIGTNYITKLLYEQCLLVVKSFFSLLRSVTLRFNILALCCSLDKSVESNATVVNKFQQHIP